MMTLTVNIDTYEDLISFIKRDDLTAEDVKKVVCSALTVISLEDLDKEGLIQATENYIERYRDKVEKPIFLTEISLDSDYKK